MLILCPSETHTENLDGRRVGELYSTSMHFDLRRPLELVHQTFCVANRYLTYFQFQQDCLLV